jgi:hypothetical protein
MNFIVENNFSHLWMLPKIFSLLKTSPIVGIDLWAAICKNLVKKIGVSYVLTCSGSSIWNSCCTLSTLILKGADKRPRLVSWLLNLWNLSLKLLFREHTLLGKNCSCVSVVRECCKIVCVATPKVSFGLKGFNRVYS